MCWEVFRIGGARVRGREALGIVVELHPILRGMQTHLRESHDQLRVSLEGGDRLARPIASPDDSLRWR
jgi:hypothetical protein